MTSQIAPLQLTNKNSGCKPMLNQEVRHQTWLASNAATAVAFSIQPARSSARAGRSPPDVSKQAPPCKPGMGNPKYCRKHCLSVNMERAGLCLHAQATPCNGAQVARGSPPVAPSHWVVLNSLRSRDWLLSLGLPYALSQSAFCLCFVFRCFFQPALFRCSEQRVRFARLVRGSDPGF